MRRFFTVMLMSGLILCAVASVYADSTRVGALGTPITLVDDSAILNTFASRLQNFPSAVYVTIAGSTVFTPGIMYVNSPMLGLVYFYDSPGGTIGGAAPSMARVSGNMLMPVNLIYGLKLGSIQLGAMYNWGYASTSEENFDTNGNPTTKDISIYQRHMISPAFSLLLNDKGTSALDISANLGLQFLNDHDSISTPGTTNENKPASLFYNLGVNAQYTHQVSDILRVAVRGYAANYNYGYSSLSDTGGTITTNSIYTLQTNIIALTAGVKIDVVEFLTLFGDLRYQFTDIGTGSPPETKYVILPTSFNIGAEAITGNWAFRLGVVHTSSKTYTITKAADGTIIATRVTPDVSTTPTIGLGYKKLPWVLNMIINPAFLNNPAWLISGAAPGAPIFAFTANYVF